MTSICKNGNEIYIHIAKYNYYTKTFDEIPISGMNIYDEVIIGYGHADSIDVMELDGNYYVWYVRGEFGKEHFICFRQLFIDADGWYLGEEYIINPFSTYNSSQLYHAMTALSDNYVCIVCSYGTTIKNDIERYHIYEKKMLMTIMLSQKTCDQSALNTARVGTGMFKDKKSLGLSVPIDKAVIQCIAMTEGTNKVIIHAPVDDRVINGVGRTKHMINSASITLKSMGSSASKTAQDMSINTSSVPITLLEFEDVSINMNYSSNPYDRFELEGLKYLSGLSGAGIDDGLCFSVNSTPFKNVAGKSIKEDKTNIPWNSFVFRV